MATNLNIQTIYKNHKTLWITLGLIIALALILLLSASYFIEHKINEKLKDIEGLKIDNVVVPWRCQHINLFGFSFNEPINNIKYNSEYEYISISGLSWWQLWRENKIMVDEVVFKNGQSKIIKSTKQVDSSGTNTKKIPEILVKKISFDNTNLMYNDPAKHNFNIANVNGSLSALSYSPKDTTQNIKYKSIDLQSGEGTMHNLNGIYSIHWDSIDLSKEKNQLSIKHLQLKPKYRKEDWSEKIDYRKSRLDLDVEDIILSNFDLSTLLFDQEFKADSLIVSNANLLVFMDQAMPDCPKCIKPILHETFDKAKIPMSLSKAMLKNCKIAIAIKSEKTIETGEIFFSNIYASIYNLNNRDNNSIHADVKAQFMDKAPMDVKMDFKLSKPNYPYSITANVGSFNLDVINPFFYLTQRITIKSGIVNNIELDFEADTNFAEGNMKFAYTDLKLELLYKDSGNKKKILSSLVNKFGIKSQNNPNSNDYRLGKINAKRNQKRDMFDHWWKAILSGFKSVIIPDLLLDEELK